MIRCTKCQTINPDGAMFCSNCASFLEWTGEKVDASAIDSKPAEEPVVAEPAPDKPAADEKPAPKDGPVADEKPAPKDGPVADDKPAADDKPTAEAPIAHATPAPDAPTIKQRTPIRRPMAAPPPPPPPPPPPTQKIEAAPAVEPAPAPVERIIAAPPELEVSEPKSEPAPVMPTAERPKPTFRFRAPVASTGSAAPTASPATVTPAPARPAPAPDEPAPRRPSAPADEPAARRPTAEVVVRPKPRPVQTLSTEPEIKPGDLICAVCGAGNDPQRRFCRRCGNSLATAVVARKPPWYRRLFGRNRRAYAAGQRPRGMGEAGEPRRSLVRPIILLVVVGLVVVLLGGYVVGSPVKGAVDGLIANVHTMVDTYNHPGAKAFDGDFATYWLADSSGSPPSASVNLKAAGDVTSVEFHSGAGIGPEFGQYRRPKTVSIQFADGDPVVMTLDDDPGTQEFPLDASGVAAFKLTIVDCYDADDPNQTLVALREVIVTEAAP